MANGKKRLIQSLELRHGIRLLNTVVFLTAAALLWTFKLPWQWAEVGMVSPWIAQFAFGFFGVMMTSTVLGLFTMVLFRPRSWCVYCPMGTMTQGICRLRQKKEDVACGGKSKEDCRAAQNTGQ